ncbi:MAG: winged helix-turn-helix domain-containing protein [Sporichthyaceae bacterium]|nr:winged helix-turn-helix domain-containing protein [Sporichthyaceae bacterium]
MDASIAPPAALMGEPTRAAMLIALIEGRALAAGELARRAEVSAATASAHLARLLDGDLVAVIKQGRHRYYRLAGPDVAAAIEALSRLSPAPPPPTSLRRVKDRNALKLARSCYDHLAGEVGVRLYSTMIERGTLIADRTDTIRLGDTGPLTTIGIELDEIRRQRRAFARPCLDWTERAPHLAGALGAALLARMFELDWLRRPANGGRGLTVTPAGRDGLAERFGLTQT